VRVTVGGARVTEPVDVGVRVTLAVTVSVPVGLGDDVTVCCRGAAGWAGAVCATTDAGVSDANHPRNATMSSTDKSQREWGEWGAGDMPTSLCM
jgi:hypothetical protein